VLVLTSSYLNIEILISMYKKMLFSYTQFLYFSFLDKISLIAVKLGRNINGSYTQNIIKDIKDKRSG